MTDEWEVEVDAFKTRGPYTFDKIYKLAKRYKSVRDFSAPTLLDKTAHKFPPAELRKILDPEGRRAETFFDVTNNWNFVDVHAKMSDEQCQVVADVGITDDLQQELDLNSLSLETRIAIVKDLREQARRKRQTVKRDLSPKRTSQ